MNYTQEQTDNANSFVDNLATDFNPGHGIRVRKFEHRQARQRFAKYDKTNMENVGLAIKTRRWHSSYYVGFFFDTEIAPVALVEYKCPSQRLADCIYEALTKILDKAMHELGMI